MDTGQRRTLTISGTGEMEDYSLFGTPRNLPPWYEKYPNATTRVVISDGVTSIGSQSFWGCTAIKSITIPDSVKSIREYAFTSCTSLESIDIPINVTSIGRYAFQNCTALTSITIPSSVASIGEFAFNGCGALRSITIPGNIGNRAFQGCGQLASVTISEGVTEIGERAFQDCSSLMDITIPSTVTSIGMCAFYDCSSLTDITIPGKVTAIGSNTFEGCSSLTDVNLPSSITSISSSMFVGCTSLKSTQIPEGVETIGNLAFNNCSSLANIQIPDSVTSIGDSALLGCSSLTDITIPSSVTSIGNFAFYDCTSLKSIQLQIPSRVSSIGIRAFYGCTALASIEIPASATSIGVLAFEGCTGLKTIIFMGDAPTFVLDDKENDTCFTGVTATVYYPAGNESWTAETKQQYGGTITWRENQFTVQFVTNDDSEISPQITTYNRTVPMPTLTKPGHRFIGWFTQDGVQYDSTTPITDNVTLYAKWTKICTVSFETNGGGTIESQQVAEGNPAAKPTDPTRSGYQFSGWFTDETCETEYTFDTAVTDTMTLYAKWAEIFTVSFETNDGGTIESQQVAEGNSAAKPTDPTKAGYRFSGWFTDEACETEYAFDTAVTGPLTLYAKWTKISSGSSGSSSTTTETTKNPDGSTTTTVTDKKTGTVTETTKGTDGSSLVVVTEANGAVTTTQTTPEQVVVKTVDQPGQAVTATVTLPAQEKTATVTIPATAVTPGTVAKNADTGEIVKLSVPTEDGLLVTLEASANLVLVDNSKDFADTDHHWAQDAIDFVTARGMFHGTSATTFSPESSMTRGMLAVVLHNFEGNPDQSFSDAFSDVSDGDWYADGIRWAASLGIVDGYGNGAFGAQDDLTREQLVTILYRYARAMGYDTTGSAPLTTFPDSAALSPYATDAMSWAVATGLITGMDDNTLTPQGTATRAQVATILMRFCTNLTK